MMKLPVHIQFRGLEASEAVETKARDFAHKLETMAPDLMACRVSIDLDQKTSTRGVPMGCASI